MGIVLKDRRSHEGEIMRLLAGFAQMRLPSLMDELNKWHPPVDVLETEDKLIIIVEIAGVSTGDINITQHGDLIRIEGNRIEVLPAESPVFHHMEINYGPFERNIRLPRKFVGGEVAASYKNGFLRIEVSKNKNAERVIKVE